MKREIEIVKVTPAMAMELLEHNKLNRPLSQSHVDRIARQITDGKWKFNGDTIKLADSGDILDGQHRLWAIVGSEATVETVIVRGVHRDAFATVDTLRKPRGGADILALNGVPNRYRSVIAAALKWLVLWQRGVLPEFRDPANRIENSDIEAIFAENHAMVAAVEKVKPATGRLCSPSVMAFCYYVMSNRNQEIADRMINVLEDPAGVGIRDPFFRLRSNLTELKTTRREPTVVIAWAFKAANAVKKGQKLERLKWSNQGHSAEEFPKLDI